MATDQDFSFPTINDSFSYSIDSPPLWNLSPATSPNPYEGLIREGSKEGHQRKSLSCIENGWRRRDHEDEDDDEKQKMDLLWEDFNEELSSRATTSTSGEEVELRTVDKRRNNNAALLLPAKNSNKPGMVVLVKVLKKLFTLSNSQGKPRRRV